MMEVSLIVTFTLVSWFCPTFNLVLYVTWETRLFISPGTYPCNREWSDTLIWSLHATACATYPGFSNPGIRARFESRIRCLHVRHIIGILQQPAHKAELNASFKQHASVPRHQCGNWNVLWTHLELLRLSVESYQTDEWTGLNLSRFKCSLGAGKHVFHS